LDKSSAELMGGLTGVGVESSLSSQAINATEKRKTSKENSTEFFMI
jgi:hypothetical protein